MADLVKIKRGLDIPLVGEAEKTIQEAPKAEMYAIIPDDFHGVVPKILVKSGDAVKAGTPLMCDKNRPEVNFVSPVSGTVEAVNRGERRKVLEIVVKSDGKFESVEFEKLDAKKMDAQAIKDTLLQSGLFAFIKQRPYDVIANPEVAPRDIFVTAFDSAPLAPEFEFVAKDEEAALQAGVDVLAKLTNGKVYVGVNATSQIKLNGCEVVKFQGAHPAGNVGVQIANIAPISKGEVVWTISAFDLLLIGRLFTTGKLDFTRIITLAGSEVEAPKYVKTTMGASIASVITGNVKKADHNQRIISGNVLTGTKVSAQDYLRAYSSQITIIPEGDDCNEFVGWATPGCGKFSVSRTFGSWLFGKNKKYNIDARLRGGERGIIMSGEYDSVFPMDILPEFLVKAVIAFDIDKMENLGIYEVAPEDFALCEFVDTSKLPLQQIIRNGLDALMKEMN
ncbi:MAG: Na(+)-translocating NADH-quinone reductase subunit A [Bacteroidaceae bacterium]|nr:Na(+)-translocating NADH-quinone reductase subunit A [Bacteroidaceae bacterium]